MNEEHKIEYRVVRQTTEKGITSADNGDNHLSVQEVYYDDETGEPMAQTMDLQVEGSNIRDLRDQLQSMLWCLDKDVVDEIQSDVMEDNMEDRVLSLETENVEMRDRLTELNDIIKDTPNNMELGDKVRSL